MDRLFSGARRFDFFQAVAWIEALAPGSAEVGRTGEPSREAVRFASSVRMSFPVADIEAIAKARPGAADKPVMTVNFLGLAGLAGPLPAPFAETILRRAARGDTAARDFLDIFNHRLVSLVYRIRKRHRIALGVTSPEQDDAFRYLQALMGLGTGHLQGRLGSVRDRTLAHYAGLFARGSRSMAGLEALLGAHFGVRVEGVALTGAFHPIDPVDSTVIGPSGRNRRLGQGAILGRRFWDQESCFELRIGPLGREDYLRFLPPDGDRLAPLCELVRLYAGRALDFRVRLILDPARASGATGKTANLRPAPPAAPQTLGERPRLGYTAWAGRAWQQRDLSLAGPALPAPSTA
jgi:type VI secretion system protein ImpH